MKTKDISSFFGNEEAKDSIISTSTNKVQRAKKNTKLKDETAPKRGKSAFLFFMAEKRSVFMSAHPTAPPTEVCKELGLLWKTLSEEDKKPFEELASKERDRYAKEKEGYTPSAEFIEKKAKKLAADAEAKPGKKGKRCKKDVNAPKKPMCAFLLFANGMRERVKSEHPEFKKVTEVMMKIGEMWKSTEHEEARKKFEQIAAEQKLVHDEVMKTYRETKKDNTTEEEPIQNGDKKHTKKSSSIKKKAAPVLQKESADVKKNESGEDSESESESSEGSSSDGKEDEEEEDDDEDEVADEETTKKSEPVAAQVVAKSSQEGKKPKGTPTKQKSSPTSKDKDDDEPLLKKKKNFVVDDDDC